ncbi:MAG: thymidine phosphorylase, partial [Gammaproteobacteria bacterium]|nr:thymidine phosphorylase [Gammaproteobacteria bacterium]
MLFTDVIRRKRDGKSLAQEDIDFFVAGLSDGSIPAEQVSALAMAIFLQSMTAKEAGMLTVAMANSGTMLQWDSAELGGPVIDKHSTGGVGDKVSFLLAPIAAACGCFVPMISGRGLGHTGGTLDKVGSIPGYQPVPDLDLFQRVVKQVGCAIIGQTSDLAPADRRLYSIRDVTSTVESVPLITASILSKKMAAGLDGLVMDIKSGSGAFTRTMAHSRELADSIINTAQASSLPCHALITDMNEVLGETAGNALEIAESMAYLRNEHREPRLDEVVIALCAQMLLVGKIETDHKTARLKVESAVSSGAAAEIFGQMVAALGGPGDFVDNYERYLPQAGATLAVYPEKSGYLATVDAFAVGNAIIELGGGRRELDDELDLSVGFSEIAVTSSVVDQQTPLA